MVRASIYVWIRARGETPWSHVFLALWGRLYLVLDRACPWEIWTQGSLWKELSLGLVSHWVWAQLHPSDRTLLVCKNKCGEVWGAVFTHIPKVVLSFPPPGPQKEVQSYCSGDTHSPVAARRTSPGGQCRATCRSWHKKRREKLALVPLQV